MSFISGHIQQVVCGDCCFGSTNVLSGVTKGSVLGHMALFPNLYVAIK